jgi:hypothetical protein
MAGTVANVHNYYHFFVEACSPTLLFAALPPYSHEQRLFLGLSIHRTPTESLDIRPCPI